jgi:uncharacterized membrane protein YeaQ/YmgE (transglycosylase-associated protein family)
VGILIVEKLKNFQIQNKDYTMESLLVSLFIGAVAGWLAGVVMKGFGFGLIGNIIVGIIGGFIGGYVLDMIGLSIGAGIMGSIITATLGAVALLAVIGFIRKKT